MSDTGDDSHKVVNNCVINRVDLDGGKSGESAMIVGSRLRDLARPLAPEPIKEIYHWGQHFYGLGYE